jgi:pyrroline-5-carboxylate reductase
MIDSPQWPTLVVVGGGQMARALIGGWLARGMPAAHIAVVEPLESQRAWLATHFPGITLHASTTGEAMDAMVWILAVKPQVLATVARSLAVITQARRPLVISIAAGIRTTDLSRWLGDSERVVRTMPNRPALIGHGITALYASATLAAEDKAIAATLLEAVGSTIWVDREADIDAVTGVSGSGPAYFFLLMELLEDAAIAQGLPADIGRQLAIETAYGAAALARSGTDDPATLREQVTSKGGTTAAALAVFENADLRGTVRHAVKAATDRACAMAQEFGQDSDPVPHHA